MRERPHKLTKHSSPREGWGGLSPREGLGSLPLWESLGGLWLLLPVLFFLILPSSAQTPEFRREYTTENPLVYEDAWDLWPYVFLDDQGKPTGYNVDLLKIIFEELGIPYVIHLKPTVQALEDLRNGKSDLMLGMVANFHDEYTTHYGRNSLQLFTHSVAHPSNETQSVHEVGDLATQQVIVHEGSFSHHLMQDHGWGENAIPLGDMDKAILRVSAEGKGQVLWNTMSLKWLIHQYHADNLTLSPVDMTSGDYRFMANDERLLEKLDNAFTKLKAAERLKPLEQKWFYPEEIEEKEFPKWLKYVAAAIGFIILSLIIASLFYKLRERRVTKESRLRNARLALILKTCKVKIWTYDVKKKNFTWYGSSPHDRKTLSFKEFGRRYTPSDYKRLMDAIDQIANKQQTDLQLEMNVIDGENDEKRAYVVILSVLRYEKGMPRTIIGTKRDVTEVRNKLKKDQELMMRYQSVFNTAMVDMVYYDREGYIQNMNTRAQMTFKMDLDEVHDEHVNLNDILSEDDFGIKDFSGSDHFYTTMFLDYSKEKPLESRKITGCIDYELLLVPVYDQTHQLLGLYGSGREVTEMVETYRQAQRSIKQLKKTLQEVADHVDNINYALQVGGVRMVTYSPQNHILTIYHRMHEAQYVLTQQRCIQLTDETSKHIMMRLLRTMDRLQDTGINCDIQSTLRVRGGKQLCLQLQLFPVFDEEGIVKEYSGICRDTTEIKHTEHMLQLETEKAQEVEQVKNKFLHNMCYEIRTPLNIVVGFAEMFEKKHSPEEEDVFIQQIKENSTYLLNLINDILFLSRLDAKMVENNKQPCDFSQTFEGHCHMAWAHKQQEKVKYVVENQYNQLIVNIDDTNIGRIINQVVSNAVKHTMTGTVRCRYEYIGGKLIIVVEDTGTGIAPDKLEHIFERFNTSSNVSQGGTGLGLPICRELATQLGGTIDISSEAGKGTSVWITIPCEAISIEHKAEI